MFGPVWRPVERKQATALEDAIDDGVGEVSIVEHVPPRGDRLVRVQVHPNSAGGEHPNSRTRGRRTVIVPLVSASCRGFPYSLR